MSLNTHALLPDIFPNRHLEFQNWAVIAPGGIPNKTQSRDKGIDGRIYPVSDASMKNARKPGEFDFMDEWYPVQVKQKDKAGRPNIDAFETAMQREGRKKGFFVAFDFTADALTEINGFFKRTGNIAPPCLMPRPACSATTPHRPSGSASGSSAPCAARWRSSACPPARSPGR
jgi:hypothetical protein